MSALIHVVLACLPVLLFVVVWVLVRVVIHVVKAMNNKEGPDARWSSIALVLVWLGGSVVFLVLVLQAYAAYMWFATVLTDNPGEADHVLSILGPVSLAGVPVGFVMVVLGAVLHNKRSPFSSGMQGVISPGDLPKQQPGQAKCPFCQSTAFRVEEEASFRRCSDCHSVLPNYIQGNR